MSLAACRPSIASVFKTSARQCASSLKSVPSVRGIASTASVPRAPSAIRTTPIASAARPSVLSRVSALPSEAPAREYVSWSTSVSNLSNWTNNESLRKWVLDWIKHMQPSRIHLCDGSEKENKKLLAQMVHAGTLVRVNHKLRPNSYVARSAASDVARVEEQTFICSENKEDAGFTNNWKEPEQIVQTMKGLFEGCMRGRTMYVVPFVMGPLDSPFAQIGIQITDSPYVVASMRIMTRMGKQALDMLAQDANFVPCVHSVGAPLNPGQEDSPWPCNAQNKYIVHFPEQRRIWSYGSGYGGNALLGKKCFALRIASVMAREEGWLAEHMLIVGITNPEGKKKYMAAAFPSACGKTNLAMMLPKLPGWKIETVGDDIAWMRIGKDGRLYAVNPEFGFFGVAPGTSKDSNPNAMKMLKNNTLFTNVAMTEDGDVWWEGMTNNKPDELVSWLRTEWHPDSLHDAAHPNARFTVPVTQCPVLDPNWADPNGVPISAIIFGGRRSSTVPLVYQARDWAHGTFLGATMNSETTAAAAGKRGVLRADPMAMKPFCGYNMGDYFGHWLSFANRTEAAKLPKVFHVNWFRKSPAGKFLWPGYGDNIRVLKWIFDRTDVPATDSKTAVETPIGFFPKPGALDVEGLNLPAGTLEQLFHLDNAEWKSEALRNKAFLSKLGSRLPEEISRELDSMIKRFDDATHSQ